MQATRKRIRLTNSLIRALEGYLEGLGKALNKPHEVRDSEIVGLLIRRQPNGRKLWYYGYSLRNGRRGRIPLGAFPSLSADGAREAAKVFAAEVAMRRDPVAEKRTRTSDSKRERVQILGRFIEGRYADYAETHLRSHRQTLACLKADFADWWGRPMSSISAFDFERWRRDELKRGIKPSTVNRSWQRLRAVLGKALEWSVIVGPLPRIRPLKLGDPRVRYLTASERTRLFDAMVQRTSERRDQRRRMNQWLQARGRKSLPEFTGRFVDHLEPLIRLILGTGLRRTEALSLRWSDIDLDNLLVRVRAETAKDKEFRAVPMTKDVNATLQEWRTQLCVTDNELDAFVFATDGGSRLLQVTKSWNSLMVRAGIENFRLHDLRHDYASRLVMAGVPLYTVSKLLGHADTEMTQRYAHLSPTYLKDAVDRLDVERVAV